MQQIKYSNNYKTIVERLDRKLSLLRRTTDLCVVDAISINEMDVYCKDNNLILPDEVKIWCSLCNGVHAGKKDNPITFGDVYGLNLKKRRHFHAGIVEELDAHPHWKISGHIPVCSDGCGSMYMLTIQKYDNRILYPVAFFEHSDSRENICDNPSRIIASNFLLFIDFMLLNELCVRRYKNYDINIPFSKKITTKHDPDLLPEWWTAKTGRGMGEE
jgi:hypothetical protein